MIAATRGVAVLTAVTAACALGAGVAAAQSAGGGPNAPAVLPPGENSPDRVPLEFEACADGAPGCAGETIAEMDRRWRRLNNSCDHRAVFALTYLRTTQEYARTISADPSFFSDVPWINWEDAVFARLYFRPFDRWADGSAVPPAWRIAFEAAGSPDVTGAGDLLLGMSAHINRDLPFTLAHVGLVKPNSESRKSDHDRVNAFLDRVVDPLQEELARRYDERFATSDAEPSPADEFAALQVVREWRERAWRNAERLVNAPTEGERQEVARSIDDSAEGTARGILAASTSPGYGATRDAYCRAHNTLELESGASGPPGSVSAMRVSVSPRRTTTRRLTRFRFTVRGGDGRPLSGATVSVGNRRARTNQRGRAVIAKRFARPGVYRARATRADSRSGRSSVRVAQRGRGRPPRFTG